MTYREDPGRRVDPQTGDDIWDFQGGQSTTPSPGSGSSATSTTPSSGSGTSSTNDDHENEGPGDYTDDEATRFNGMPGHPEIWKDSDTGVHYLVYFPESGPQPPVPLLFEISTDEELKSLFGNHDPVADKELTAEQMMAAGSVKFGEMASIDRYDASGQLIKDPWAGFTSRMDRAMDSMPWLAEDPEVFGLVAGAYLEGREIEPWELEQTEYFQSHSKAERESMRLQIGDPEGYADRQRTYESTVYDTIASMGLDPNSDVVSWIATEYNAGRWTIDDVRQQAQVYAGLGGPQELNADFASYLEQQGIETGGSANFREDIRTMFNTYLGPAFPPDDAALSLWASRFADNPEAGRDALEEHLRTQFHTLFPNYDDPSATYATVAAPWRSYTQNIWGVPVDETDAAFQNIIQMNDPMAAQSQARKVGSDRGYARVTETMMSELEQGMRSGVRGAV